MKAICLWDLSRICLSLEGTTAFLLEEPKDKHKGTHGYVTKAQTDLTLKEAKKLVSSLSLAIGEYEAIDRYVNRPR